ncbi:MAG TPA: DUF5009 domain-containing protein [Armatimonadota bacterium]|nr:DUF5009 domain-containing protein [Armatimonadota bacterium]
MAELSLPQRNRICSIDVLRGITIFLMVFVNDLAGVNGAPWWMRHFPSDGDGMTFVDLVFPAFLFVMGMSIPAALGKRLDAGKRWFEVLPHVLIRSASLLVIGVLMVNNPGDERMGWHAGLWGLLMYSAVFLVWHTFPSGSNRAKLISGILRWTGAVALILLALVFRNPEGDWLRTQWYGILGLIGLAYLIASLVYLVFRDNRTALTGVMALLFCVYIAFREGLLRSEWFGGGMVGSHPAIAVGGVFLGTLLYGKDLSPADRRKAALALIGFAAAAAWLLRPLYGIGKNPATPSWCLWSIAITAAVWVLLHVAVDMHPHERPFRPFRFLGTNPLFAYLLAPLVYCGFQAAGLNYDGLGDLGFPAGLARSAVFTLVICGIAAGAARGGVRLKL